MSPKRDLTPDMLRLANVIRRRISDYDSRHRRRFPIDPTLSKLLKEPTPRRNPGIFTIRDIAARLDTTVGDLLTESILGEADLEKLRALVNFLIDRFDLMGTRAAAKRGSQFAVNEAEFVERDHDYQRPHHVWVVPHAMGAAGGGIEAGSSSETTEVLHSIRDVYNGELRVIRVIGESMAPVLRHDDKIIIDTRRTTPRDGEIVAVYHHRDGGILGYWNRNDDAAQLDKENPGFPPIRLEAAGGWTLWGTATRIVDTPIARRPRR